MIDPNNTLIIYIGGESILAEKMDCLIQYSHLSNNALISSLSSLYTIPKEQILTYTYENDTHDSLDMVFDRTADKIYYELTKNEIYVRSKPETLKITNFGGIFDVLEDMQSATKDKPANILFFLEDHGSPNFFSKWPCMHMYQILLMQFPLSLRIFYESCSSSRFINYINQYNQIYNVLRPVGVEGQINIRDFGFFIQILNKLSDIPQGLTIVLSLLTYIYDIDHKKHERAFRAEIILRKFSRVPKVIDKLMKFEDNFSVTDPKIEKAFQISNTKYLNKVGIKKVFDLKLLMLAVITFKKISSTEFTFANIKNVMNNENFQKYNKIHQLFNNNEEFNNIMMFYIETEKLYPPVHDFKIISASNSFTFLNLRINPVTKLIPSTPLIASAIEEVFLNITSAPIDLHQIESKFCKNEYPINRIDGKYRWLKAFPDKLQSTSSINDRFLTPVLDKLKEKAALMRVATEMIDIIIQRVQSSIREIAIPKLSSKEVIERKMLQSLIGLSSIVPFFTIIDKSELDKVMNSLDLNLHQKVIIETILKFEMNERQMVIAAENAVGMIYDVVSEVVDSNLSLVDAMTILINKEAYFEASVAASLIATDGNLSKNIDHNSFVRKLIDVLKHEHKDGNYLPNVMKITKDSLLSHARESLNAIEGFRDDVLKVIETFLSSGLMVMEKEMKEQLYSFDYSEAEQIIVYFINRAVAVVFENADIGDNDRIDAILDDNMKLNSHSPDVCAAVKHCINPKIYLTQLLIINQDSSTSSKIELLEELVFKDEYKKEKIKEKDISDEVLGVVNKLNTLRQEIINTYVKTFKNQFNELESNLISLYELAAQTLLDEGAVRRKAKLLNDQLNEYDIEGIVAFSSVIARSLRSRIAIHHKPEDMFSLSNDFIVSEVSAVLTNIRSDIMIEQDEGEKKEVIAVALKLFDNPKISNFAFRTALQIVTKTQLQNSYPVEYIVKFMEKMILENEEMELIKKLPITISRTDIIHLIGLTRFNPSGKKRIERDELNAFDTFMSTIDPETDEYDSNDESSQFLPIHFEVIKEKPEETPIEIEWKPLTIEEALSISRRLKIPKNGYGGDIMTVVEHRFNYYISRYGLKYDPSTLILKINSVNFIKAEIKGLKILPLYYLKAFEDNVLNYGGFFAKYPEYGKELIECFVQSVDDADRAVTPLYYLRDQYYPDHK